MNEHRSQDLSDTENPAAIPQSPPPLRVLVVDDNPDHAFLTAQTLLRSAIAFAPIIVGDGASCLDVVQRDAPAAVVLDYRLPDTDGLALLAQVAEIAPYLPVVLLTGEGNEEVAVAAMKLGAADYVVKDGEAFKSLPEIIQTSIERFQQHAESERAGPPPTPGSGNLLWDELPGVLSIEALTAFANAIASETARREAAASLILLAAGTFQSDLLPPDELDARLLRVAAAIVLRSVRGSDIVARHSVRSLAIFAQSTNSVGALRLAQRISAALPERITIEGQEVPLLVAQGIAELQPRVASLDDLFSQAETTLSQAIESGGRSIRASEEPPAQVDTCSANVPGTSGVTSAELSDLSLARQAALTRLTEAYEHGEVEGVAVHTSPGACPTCLDAARDFYLPFMTPPLPLVGCMHPDGCRCTYRSPDADPRFRPPPVLVDTMPPFDIPRKLRDAAVFGSDPKRGCRPEDLAEYLDHLPLLPVKTDRALHEREVAYLIRPARRAWERATLGSVTAHGPLFPFKGSLVEWVRRVPKPPFLPGDAIPQRDEGTLLITNWRLIFYRRDATESSLLVDVSDLEYLRDGIACSMGSRSNRKVFLLRDPLQVGLYLIRALRDIASL